jgi:hypothetical protein
MVTGFEAGVLPIGTGLWSQSTTGGTSAIDATVKRNGGYSLKVAKTTGLSYAATTISSTAPVGVVRFALRFATLPVADVNQLAVLQTTGGNSPAISYVSASQKLRLRLNGEQRPGRNARRGRDLARHRRQHRRGLEPAHRHLAARRRRPAPPPT